MTGSDGDHSMLTAPRDVLLERYEELRREALGSSGGRRGHGLALFLGCGMAAWMEAWSSCALEGSSALAPSGAATNGAVPPARRDEVVLVLAGMALDRVEEVRT